MGLIKWLCRKFNCKSECQFDGERYRDDTKLNHKLSMYHLKHKDICKILNILDKRNLKADMPPAFSEISEI